MKTKKSVSANLENKRLLFLQIGIILSLTIALTAFEMRSYDVIDIAIDKYGGGDVEIEYPPITIIPKIPEPKIVITDIKVIINEPLVEPENLEFTADVTPETKLPVWIPPQIEDEPVIIDDTPVRFVTQSPEFPGGEVKLFSFLRKNLKYPTMAIENGYKGVVYVGFVVERDGSITNISIDRGVGGGCDEEAIRVIKMMPKWIPGQQLNKKVRVQYSLPVRFVLE